MARGVASPAPNPLPKVSFVRVNDEISRQTNGVADQIARSYGYNGPSMFQQEKHYIRYIEPLESDLAVQVEYDMDEQDQEWVDALNAERKAQHLDKITYETFEIVMDRLEKEWFDLTKNIPKTDIALPSEDSTCAICDDSEGENANAIVFCDGCNLAVHQDCYGVPYIPEGQWLCRKCTVSPENPVSCILCPNEGGAFKQTVSGDWVHLLCAIWVPETAVANEVFMEPITGVEKISKQRWRLRCSICDEKHGACIQCTKPSCFTAFHATCARKEKLLMPMKASQGSEAPVLACYCEKHLPPEQQKVRAAALQNEPDDGDEVDGHTQAPKSSKSARAYNKTYKPGPPLVPKIIVNRIMQYISRIHVRHKQEFVHLVCRYWSLKREARRGAPLLKRLHLEPWTALSGSKQQTDQEKAVKLDLMKVLRNDLEKLHTIADLVRRRERVKQAQAEAMQDVLLHFLFPHEGPLRLAFQKITAHDRQHSYFKTPVNKTEVPDYYDVIKSPMWWDEIDQKLDRHEYLDLAEFKRDINLVLDNAITYNQPASAYYKTAIRIRNAAQAPLAELDKLVHHPAGTAPDAEPVVNGKIEETEAQSTQLDVPMPQIGDLEPPLDILDLLMSEESIRQDTNLILTTTPIESLLNFELPLIRPPAPPPPPAKRPSSESPLEQERKRRRIAKEKEEKEKEIEKEKETEKEKEREREEEKEREKEKGKKGKYDRSAALKRAREERQAALDASPGFRLTRTRAGAVAVAAFEGEAGGTSETPDGGSAAEDQLSVEASSSTAPPDKPKRQRKSMAPPGQDMPITVQDVDSWQSFKLFEQGWILPADHKRRGRATVERPPQPPPRKRTKTSKSPTSVDITVNGLLISFDDHAGHKKTHNADVSMESTDGEVTHPSAEDATAGDGAPNNADLGSSRVNGPAPSDSQDTTSAEALRAPSSEAPTKLSEIPIPALPELSASPTAAEAIRQSSPKPPSRARSKSPASAPLQLPETVRDPPSSPPPSSPSPSPLPPHEQPEPETSAASHDQGVPEPSKVEALGAPPEAIDEDIEIDVVTVSSPAPVLAQPEASLPLSTEASTLRSASDTEPQSPSVPEATLEPKPETAPAAEATQKPKSVPEPSIIESPGRNVPEETAGAQLHDSRQSLQEALEPPAKPSAPEPDPDETEDEFIDGSEPPKPPQPLDMSPPPELRMRQELKADQPDRMDVDEPQHIEVEGPKGSDVEQQVPLEPVSPEIDLAEPTSLAPSSPTHPARPTAVVEHQLQTADQSEPETRPDVDVPQEKAQAHEETTTVPAEESQPTRQEEEEDRRPRKIIWIDVLDTPAIRREKAKQKKLEKEARKRRGVEAFVPAQPIAGPSRLAKAFDADAMDVDSDLTDLTDLDSDATEDDESVPEPASSARPKPAAPAQKDEPREPGMIVLGEDEKVEGGTLVWAKTGSFPYWPAVVFEEDDPEVPPNVLATAPDIRDNGIALVRFYEKKSKSNWSWVKVKNMRYLGEDDGLDAAMLAPTSRYQKWRSAAKRAECRDAFQDALAEMEGEDETQANILIGAGAAVSSTGQPQPLISNTSGRMPPLTEEPNATIEAAMGADSPMTEVE
ncbi:hypothetical protein BD311DRAFT_702623 [Dichomitus squalens]|uniref:Uncharacterized protein n=1 Tax=Dichomitus squalens TaxID=114155 RepID=A0A4Q9MDP5_9APHY|nr:hypothetical protein BD311DRAFT_702623 [Dichomitus squalens]